MKTLYIHMYTYTCMYVGVDLVSDQHFRSALGNCCLQQLSPGKNIIRTYIHIYVPTVYVHRNCQ